MKIFILNPGKLLELLYIIFDWLYNHVSLLEASCPEGWRAEGGGGWNTFIHFLSLEVLVHLIHYQREPVFTLSS